MSITEFPKSIHYGWPVVSMIERASEYDIEDKARKVADVSYRGTPGPVFMKGLRLREDLGLNPCSLKVKTFVSDKFCLKTVFTKGDLAKSKIIK